MVLTALVISVCRVVETRTELDGAMVGRSDASRTIYVILVDTQHEPYYWGRSGGCGICANAAIKPRAGIASRVFVLWRRGGMSLTPDPGYIGRSRSTYDRDREGGLFPSPTASPNQNSPIISSFPNMSTVLLSLTTAKLRCKSRGNWQTPCALPACRSRTPSEVQKRKRRRKKPEHGSKKGLEARGMVHRTDGLRWYASVSLAPWAILMEAGGLPTQLGRIS